MGTKGQEVICKWRYRAIVGGHAARYVNTPYSPEVRLGIHRGEPTVNNLEVQTLNPFDAKRIILMKGKVRIENSR